MRSTFLFKINFAVLLVCFCESALTPEIKKAYGDFLAGKGLYTEDDGIVLLNATNLRTKIYGTSNSWLVEFYNSWCGHCHKFAPVWRSLATNLQEWKNVVQLAAIDCAEEDHTTICREYDIMSYPTVRFFSANSPQSSLGTDIPKISSKTEEAITKDVVGILQKEQMEGRGNTWPNIIPYRSYDTKNLWKDEDSWQYIFLVFADENDPLATEIILDLSNVEGIEIRGVVSDNEVLSKLLGVHSYPSLLVIERSKNEPEFLHPEEHNRVSYRLAVKAFLKDKGYTVPDEPKIVKMLSQDEMPNIADLHEARETLAQIKKIKEFGDVVFLVDLENALRYSLEHEIPSRKNITGESLRALNNYLEVLDKYFPASKEGELFFQKLREKVSLTKDMTGMKLKVYMSNLSNGNMDSVLTSKEDWLGCRGSESHFRRYPCGMWTLFHYMTVNALQDLDNPQQVLEAMVGYITHFFGCTECSKHFQQMTENRAMREKVKTPEQAVLWLWSAHNQVNQRLAKDESEDPEFPKIQFPSPERCPNCRDSKGHWDEGNVLKYLKKVYNQENLNLLGSSVKLSLPNKTMVSHDNQSKSNFFAEDSPKKISKDFNVFDISLCVVLYIVSAVICIGVCLKFILKKRHRRKSHGLDLLGKV